MNKNQDFDQSVPCDFQLLTQCGGKAASSFTWYNWNAHYWGTSIEYRVTSEVTFKTGVLEQNPSSTARSHAWSWSTKGSKGLLLPLEVEWKTNYFSGLPGVYNLGVLYTNAKQQDLSQGNSQANGADDPQGYEYHQNTWFMYAGFNQQITSQTDDATRGISISGSVGLSDPRSNFIHQTWSTSIRYRGPFDVRPNDWIGFGVSYINMSSHYQKNQADLNQISGINDYENSLYHPVPGDSINSDLYYRLQVTPWFSLQPDLQYWHRPGGLSNTQDAWVVGLKTMLIF